MKKKKDATGSPHNLAGSKNRATARPKKKPGISREHSQMEYRKPNNFGRGGNDADREMESMRGMDKEKQMLQRKKHKGGK